MSLRFAPWPPTSGCSRPAILDRGLALLLCLALVGCGDRSNGDLPRVDAPPAIVERISRPGDGGDVHLVRAVQRADQFRFQPDTLNIPPADVVRFVLTGPQPESIAFDAAAATPAAADYIRERGLDLGVLLVEPGQAFDVAFVGAPAGRYPFLSLPHADRGMRGVVVVSTPD